MFVPQKLHPSNKKPFQKPNILRRRPKSKVKANVAQTALLNNVSVKNDNRLDSELGEGIPSHNISKERKESKVQNVFKPTETELDANISTTCELNNDLQSNDKFLEQSTLNIESFMNDDEETDKGIPLSYVETTELLVHSSQGRSGWPCMELYPINHLDTKHSETTCQESETQAPQQGISNVTTVVNTKPVNCSNQLIKFKCNVPDCNKDFWMIEHLIKHLKSHNNTVKDTSEMFECPVKKLSEEGVEEKCPQTFHERGDLLKHLKSDHSPEDALHRWRIVCGSGGGGLACGWAGCGRVFRLPCRLREHQRAHTGDRPYMCTHPGCGWAFRSARKLGRHARRHTGERRHACAACGRAFRRRDHLRDHARRLHAPTNGCEETVATENTMYVMNNVNREDENDIITLKPTAEPETLIFIEQNEALEGPVGEEGTLSEEVVGVEEGEGEEGEEEEGAGGAARTHCAWPLRRTLHTDALTHIDQVEDSSSNVYTVRSDLFLHGNVPIEDDSQHIGADIVEDGEECTALDADLGLIDSHPIDLMQEELMYDDAAVDESSFRVFLINGDELA